MTRDVALTKAAPEAEPAPVLDLTPPTPVSDKRVANDPRERRRLAKQAAEQALEQAKQAHSEPEVTPAEAVPAEVTPVTEAETVTAEVAEPVVTEAVAETAAETIAAPVETEQAAKPVQAELAVEAAQDVPTELEPKAEAEKTEGEDADKPVRPRRPRGRPPKKATPANES